MSDFNYQDYLSNFGEIENKFAPKELFIEGDSTLLTEGVKVAVVGTRKPSDNGIKRTKVLVNALVKQGITVVSGLADGVDTIAHETAINNNGRTIAVLGTPLSKVYPAKNKDLLNLIKKDHLAVSQFPEYYPFQKKNFPMRNVTMALISDATVIVEASENSGTKHQGWAALRLGRVVFLLNNLIENENLTWPKEMIKYGAQVIQREDLPEIFDVIPSFTSNLEIDFTP